MCQFHAAQFPFDPRDFPAREVGHCLCRQLTLFSVYAGYLLPNSDVDFYLLSINRRRLPRQLGQLVGAIQMCLRRNVIPRPDFGFTHKITN